GSAFRTGRHGTPPRRAEDRRRTGPRRGAFLQGSRRDHGGADRNVDEPPGARPRSAADDARRHDRSGAMTFSEETLMAYADDELDSETRSAVEAAMETDPEIARRVARHKALRGQLRATFDKVL